MSGKKYNFFGENLGEIYSTASFIKPYRNQVYKWTGFMKWAIVNCYYWGEGGVNILRKIYAPSYLLLYLYLY